MKLVKGPLRSEGEDEALQEIGVARLFDTGVAEGAGGDDEHPARPPAVGENRRTAALVAEQDGRARGRGDPVARRGHPQGLEARGERIGDEARRGPRVLAPAQRMQRRALAALFMTHAERGGGSRLFPRPPPGVREEERSPAQEVPLHQRPAGVEKRSVATGRRRRGRPAPQPPARPAARRGTRALRGTGARPASRPTPATTSCPRHDPPMTRPARHPPPRWRGR